MICELCKQNEAIVHIKKVINGKITKLDLCEECAKNSHQLEFDSGISLQDFLKGLMSFANKDISFIAQEMDTVPRCARCGLSYDELVESGRLGCTDCYSSFSKQLPSVLKRIHGNIKHEGKVPKTMKTENSLKKELDEYKEKLKNAIVAEEYEKAAEYRDKIKEMEKIE